MPYALIMPRTPPIVLAPPCGDRRDPRHFHCTDHHGRLDTPSEVEAHLRRGCPVVYCCPRCGPELPFELPSWETAQDARRDTLRAAHRESA
jgi:hypothetical protein